MLEATLVILLLLITVFLVGSIRFRFRFDAKYNRVELMYLFFDARLDMMPLVLQIRLAGIKVYSFRLSDKKEKKPSVKTDKLKAKKDTKKKKPFNYRVLSGWRQYLSKTVWLLKKIRIAYLNLKIRGGFADPYYTGNSYAFYSVACGVVPSVMKHIDFKPDFNADKIIFEGKGLIYIRMYYIINVALFVLRKLLGMKIRELFVIHRKGVSYG